MTNMTKDQMVILAQRISTVGENVQLEDFLGALGVVVFNCFAQFSNADRLQAVTAWHGALFRELAALEIRKKKAN